jgi:hypothetical protein
VQREGPTRKGRLFVAGVVGELVKVEMVGHLPNHFAHSLLTIKLVETRLDDQVVMSLLAGQLQSVRFLD